MFRFPPLKGGAVLWQALPAGALGEGAQEPLQEAFQGSWLNYPVSPPISTGRDSRGQHGGSGCYHSANLGQNEQGQKCRSLPGFCKAVDSSWRGDVSKQDGDLAQQESLSLSASKG